MRRAKGVVVDECHIGEAVRQLAFEDRPDLVAAAQVVPQESDGLALDARQTLCERPDLYRLDAARPDHRVITAVPSCHGLFLCEVSRFVLSGAIEAHNTPTR